MTDYPKALAAAREAHTYVKHLGMTRAEAALGDLLAALDAARGETRQKVKDTLTDYLDHYPHPEFLDAVMAHFVTAAPPAADAALADTQRAIIEAAERRGYERALADLRAYGPEAMLAAAERGGLCPDATRCDCIGSCKRSMRGNGAVGEVVTGTLNGIAGPYTNTRAELLSAGIPHGTKLYAAPPAAVPADNVTPMRQPRADLARLVESIKAAVYADGDGLSVTEAIGALELAKLELLKEQEQ